MASTETALEGMTVYLKPYKRVSATFYPMTLNTALWNSFTVNVQIRVLVNVHDVHLPSQSNFRTFVSPLNAFVQQQLVSVHPRQPLIRVLISYRTETWSIKRTDFCHLEAHYLLLLSTWKRDLTRVLCNSAWVSLPHPHSVTGPCSYFFMGTTDKTLERFIISNGNKLTPKATFSFLYQKMSNFKRSSIIRE